jgi:hypothetical protein
MKVVLSFFFLLFLNLNLEAQVFNNVYNNFMHIYNHPTNGFSQYNREAFYNHIFIDTELILFGSTEDPTWNDTTLTNTFVVKVNQLGDTIYQKEIAISSFGVSIVSTSFFSNQKYFQFGYVQESLGNGNFERKGVIANCDTNFNVLSTQVFDYGDETSFFGVEKLNSRLYLLGYADVDTSSNTDYDFLITKFDTLGIALDTFLIGGSDWDIPRAIKSLPNNHLLVSGYTYSFGAGDEDLFLVELDTLGNIVWQQTYGYPGSDLYGGTNILTDENDNIYLCGWTELNTGNKAAWLIKTDNLGNIHWEKKFDRGPHFDGFVGMQFLNETEIVLIGSTHNYEVLGELPTGWLLKVDTSGNQIWERFPTKYNNINGSNDYINGLGIDYNGNFYFYGYVSSGFVSVNGIYHDNDAWLCKTDSCGFNTNNPTEALLVLDSIVGYTVYISNLSQEYCTGTYFVSDVNGITDSSTIYAYSEWTNGDNPNQMQYTFSDTGSYEIGLYVTGGDSTSFYAVQFSIEDTTSSIANLGFESNIIKVFPNPTQDYIIIETDQYLLSGEAQSLQCAVYTPTGRLTANYSLNPKLHQQRVFVDELANGIYILNFMLDGQSIGNKRLSVVR